MSDNVDFYRKLLFRPPPPRKLAAITVLLGIFYGVGSTLALSPSSDLEVNILGAFIAAVFFYIVPALLSSETVSRIGGVSRKWAYMMAIFDLTIVFLFSLLIPFTDSGAEAWQILWLGLATVYLANLLMVLLARGQQSVLMNIAYPFIYPGTVLIMFHVTVGQLVGIPGSIYIRNSILFLVSAFLLLLTVGIYNFLLRGNIRLSTLEFFPALVLGEQRALPGGIETDVFQQMLEVDNGEKIRFNIPWVHPGPVAGFGGGRLTSELIDEDVFMLHIPSYHTLDLTDPASIDRFRDMPEAETAGEASRLLKLEKNGFTLWGRKYGDRNVVFIQNREIDDYEPSIAYSLKEEYPDLCLIDLHNQMLEEDPEKWLEYMDKDRRLLEEAVDEMVDMLATAEKADYSAGVGGDTDYRCLVEEVDGQRTCLLGVNASDAPAILREVEDELGFDESLVFTTDSHEDLVEMADPSYEKEELQEAVVEADNDLSDAEAGIGERSVEDVGVLGKEYEGLITTLNIMGRLVPITLILYYVAIVFLIL